MFICVRNGTMLHIWRSDGSVIRTIIDHATKWTWLVWGMVLWVEWWGLGWRGVALWTSFCVTRQACMSDACDVCLCVMFFSRCLQRRELCTTVMWRVGRWLAKKWSSWLSTSAVLLAWRAPNRACSCKYKTTVCIRCVKAHTRTIYATILTIVTIVTISPKVNMLTLDDIVTIVEFHRRRWCSFVLQVLYCCVLAV